MTAIACIEDLQKLAKRRVPRMFYDYADSGSWTESTYRANESDLAAIKFRQRVALDVSNRTTEMSMLGQKLPMPVALAPTGLTGMQHADGEILAAKAAAEFGVPFTLSTMSICSIEDVAENSPDIYRSKRIFDIQNALDDQFSTPLFADRSNIIP